MKSFLFFLVFASTVTICAQTQRFYYELDFFSDVDKTIKKKDILVVDISEEKLLCYSNEYLRIDSLNSVNNTFSFAYPKFKTVVLHTLSDPNFTFINNLSMNYYVYEKPIHWDWTLLNETKKIGSFKVQKATTTYGGRNWTAWFCAEIPINGGPYVFSGLPGFILELYDKEENYHFKFLQSKNLDNSTFTFKKLEKYLGIAKFSIKPNDWKTIRLNYYNNPIAQYKSGQAKSVKRDGSDYTPEDYRIWEKSIRAKMRLENNPIELDEAVNYPIN